MTPKYNKQRQHRHFVTGRHLLAPLRTLKIGQSDVRYHHIGRRIPASCLLRHFSCECFKFRANQQQNEDEGPDGEVEFLTGQTTFNIAVDDSTGKGFKIKAWDLSGDGDLNETFTPTPGVDLPEPVSNLTITIGAEGAGQKNKYKGYYVTLIDSDGYQIELDPRVYEKR